MGEYLWNFGKGKYFSVKSLKTLTMKHKIVKLDFIKMSYENTLLRKLKGSQQIGNKY